MAIEILKESFQNIGGNFGQVTAPEGKVSVWAVHDGAAKDGFYSARSLMDKGLAFGQGDRRVVTGFTPAKIGDGKDKKDNIIEGPSGQKYIELHIDAKDMAERTAFEASIGNARVKQQERTATSDEFMKRSNLIQETVETKQLLATSFT